MISSLMPYKRVPLGCAGNNGEHLVSLVNSWTNCMENRIFELGF